MVDLFSGAGGFSLGFEQAGFVPRMVVDNDVDSLITFRANRRGLPVSRIRNDRVERMLDQGEFRRFRKRITAVIGGPPCQTFSIVGWRTKKNDAKRHQKIRDDARTWLPVAMARVIGQVRPRFAVLENVAHFRSAGRGRVRDATVRVLRRNGFSCAEVGVWSNYHGVPQRRRRFFLIGLRNDAHGGPAKARAKLDALVAALESRSQPDITLATALRGLPRIGPSGGREYTLHRGQEIWHHYARPHNRRDLKIYRALRPGENARDLEARRRGMIPYRLTSFVDKYRKLRLDAPAPTVPAHLSRDANSFVLPGVNRGLTPREAARIQGFPDGYLFPAPQSGQFIQIGNAVPPPLARHIAMSIRRALRV